MRLLYLYEIQNNSPMTRPSITDTIVNADALLASGSHQEAIGLYQQWLEQGPSPMDWAAHFNLGVVLKDNGDLAGAQQAFAAALAQNPGLAQAGRALDQVSPILAHTARRKVQLFSIAWSPATLVQTDPNIAILDNSANLRPDWREYWAIRHYLQNTPLDANTFYGFLSPKFASKTGLTGADVIRFIDSEAEADVFTFSPQADMGAFFLNVFVQGETFDPGFLNVCQELLGHIGQPMDLRSLVMDSRQVVFSNFIVARPAFWQQWLALCEKIFQLAEANDSPLAAQINTGTTYPGQVPRKVFIIERMASLLLACSPWRCAPYSTFQCAWSALPTAQFQNEAIASDALKLAYNETRHNDYLGAYAALQKRIFPAPLIQVVQDYRAIVPLVESSLEVQGDSASPKALIFHVFEDNSRPIEVLDIGFGAGNLGFHIRNNPATSHWAVDGVDGFQTNCHNAALIEKSIYRNIWHGLAQDIPSQQFEKYQIICLLDVIEHLPADTAKQLLRELLTNMRQDAFLFISTPLWFYPQDTLQPGDLEEHLIGVPATSMMALLPKMYSIASPLVGGFILGKRSLEFLDFFHPTTDKNFSYQQGLAIAQAIGCNCQPGTLVKLW
jgi:2-polyprenyl-3-methyl-5-hydroxy-6-metoxy-1,4-benzoquinol methylase/tetratricopeptide (TPR) repeat protein